MPVTKNQSITLVDYPEKGVNTNLDPAQQLVGETELIVACDSATCNNKISWIVEKAGESEDAVPDDAFRILILEHFGGVKQVFCSWDCLRRYMKNYVPPLSPREKALIEAHNAAITEVAEPVVQNTEAVTQPDGFAEEITNER